MTTFLIRLFIKDYQQIQDPNIRQKYGILGSCVGICCNIFLFLAKLMAGILTSSISILADAFNNLSDAGSSIVTLLGFKIAGLPADANHPFGHGRAEYISGFIVSLVIMLMGFELGKSSFEKILHPQIITFHWLSLFILLLSIAVKLWMALFNRTLGKKINSAAMQATSLDSLSDMIATLAVTIGMLIHHYFHLNIDGYIGLLVALFIIYTGFMTAKDTLNLLMGQNPDPDFVNQIETKVLQYPEIVGIHDLIVHNYGPGKSIISLHAEVPCQADILKIHDVIDTIERELKLAFHCEAVIHIDPIATNDKKTNEVKNRVEQLIKVIDPCLAMHDFRMVPGDTHTNLIFDVVVPHKFRLNDEEVLDTIAKAVKVIDEAYEVTINIDKSF